MIFLNILLLLVGFVLLIKGADFFVDGSSSIAKLLKIPSVVIGLTIVAMGTSAPEAAVSVSAAPQGSNEIAVSNVVGSNIFNMLAVIGVCSLIKPMPLDRTIVKRDLPVNIVAIGILLALVLVGYSIGRIDGAIMLAIMIAYITYLVVNAIKNREDCSDDIKTMSPILSVICIIGGLAAIIFGGNLVVENAKAIASAAGLSETFIGLTIVAVGTSLPELVTSVVASKKGENGLALGNVVGSNIFNILFILDLSSVVTAIAIDSVAVVNIIIVLIVTVLLWVLCLCSKKLGRIPGAVMVASYIAYTVYLIIKG